MFLDDKAHERFLEILFQDRNKRYGAFFLRRTYSRRVFYGTLVAVGSVLLLLLFPYIIEALKPGPKIDLSNKYIPVAMAELPEPPSQQLTYEPQIKMPEKTIPVVIKDSVAPEQKKTEKQERNEPNPKADTSGSTAGPPGGGNGTQAGTGPYGGAGSIILPIVPGGKGGGKDQMIQDWTNYVRSNLQLPQAARKKGLTGMVTVRLFITKDGSVANASIKRSVAPELDQAALDFVYAMPKWKPGISNGWPAVTPLDLPVDFRLAK